MDTELTDTLDTMAVALDALSDLARDDHDPRTLPSRQQVCAEAVIILP